MTWLVSPGKAPVERRAALQVQNLLSSQSLKGEVVVQGGIDEDNCWRPKPLILRVWIKGRD